MRLTILFCITKACKCKWTIVIYMLFTNKNWMIDSKTSLTCNTFDIFNFIKKRRLLMQAMFFFLFFVWVSVCLLITPKLRNLFVFFFSYILLKRKMLSNWFYLNIIKIGQVFFVFHKKIIHLKYFIIKWRDNALSVWQESRYPTPLIFLHTILFLRLLQDRTKNQCFNH